MQRRIAGSSQPGYKRAGVKLIEQILKTAGENLPSGKLWKRATHQARHYREVELDQETYIFEYDTDKDTLDIARTGETKQRRVQRRTFDRWCTEARRRAFPDASAGR